MLTIHALHVVKRVRTNPSGGYVIDVEQIDTLGNVLATKELTCTHLFVGAGSMGTSELLVRARERGDLPNLNEAVGTGWGPNGDIFCMLDNPLTRPTGDKHCTLPSHKFEALDQLGKVATIRFTPLPLGLPTWVTGTIMLADNPERGYFSYDPASDKVNLHWDSAQSAPSVAAARFIYDKINVAARTKYSDVVQFEGAEPFNPNVTYHPLGGVPLGQATDDYGRIREHSGLYVVDGSLIPVGIGTNPLLAITALAERNIERVILEDMLA